MFLFWKCKAGDGDGDPRGWVGGALAKTKKGPGSGLFFSIFSLLWCFCALLTEKRPKLAKTQNGFENVIKKLRKEESSVLGFGSDIIFLVEFLVKLFDKIFCITFFVVFLFLNSHLPSLRKHIRNRDKTKKPGGN
jgi:hypothetical protein